MTPSEKKEKEDRAMTDNQGREGRERVRDGDARNERINLLRA